MPAATHAFGVRETLLGPGALPPPPVRHALFASLVALAAILHFCSVGWTEIHNGVEGEFASGARQMLDSPHPLLPIRNGVVSPEEPPLLYWALTASYRVFGVTAVAARVPSALAMVTLVALTFLIAERLSGYWRGFNAGLIQLCLCGSFLWGRMVAPEPLFASLIAGAILCAVSGYDRRRERRWWFAGFWCCTALAYLTIGAKAIAFLAALILLLVLLFREARMRFTALLHWSGLLAFVAIVVPWHVWLQARVPGHIWITAGPWLNPLATDVNFTGTEHVTAGRFLLGHLVWWYPALLLVIPGLLFAWRRVIRPREMDFSDAVPLCWMAVGFVPLLFVPQRQHFDSLPMWSAFSLWAACAWGRTPFRLRIAGIAAAAAGCAIAVICLRSDTFRAVAFGLPFGQQPFASLLMLCATVAALVAFAGAGYLLWRKEETLATAVMLLGTLPLGLSVAEADARRGPYASFGTLARSLPFGDDVELIYDGSLRSGSSLAFYLRRPLSVISEANGLAGSKPDERHLTELEALDRFGAAHPVYLVLHKDRIPLWQERLTTRYHIYHQVSTCGAYVVVSNQP